MKTKIVLVINLFLITSGFFMAQDLKVFDLKLGESMNIKECDFQIVESASKNGIAVKKDKWRGLLGKKPNISKMYLYTENIARTDKCFQRVGLYYTESAIPGTTEENLPPVLPPNNQKVKLIYSKDAKPGIADREDIWIGIQDNKITGVRFYFNFHNADTVYQVLTKKFGTPSVKKDYFITAPMGNRIDYYESKWNLPKLKVTFLSIDTNQIGYNPGDAPIGYLSEVGSVTIQYLIPEKNTIQDHNKL